ncbi:hypothetical protein SDC9_93748 [bioreactor metagenome]|uniref:Uncharacterized protein n=1 Tax=bioreactor metagenome TaxID=1076179 RepID=A0A645A1G8_9ZZZZ
MVVDLFYLAPEPGNILFGLVGIEFQDTRHLYLHQPQDILRCYFADK